MIPIANPTPIDRAEGRLLNLAALFLGITSIALSLAPLVRGRSLQASLDWDHWLGFFSWLVLFNLLHFFSARRLPNRDPFLLPIAGLLTGWGMLMIDRLTAVFGMRQTLWLLLIGAIFLLGLRLPPNFLFLRRYKYLWLISGLILTGLTIFFGTNPLGYGPRMWLGCCGIYLQPSEPLKLLLIIYLSAYLADRLALPGDHTDSRTISLLPLLAPTLIMTGLALALLVIQRDLGTASIFLFLYAVIVYVASGRRRVALSAVGILIIASVAGYFLFDVVRVRFDAWLNPWLDPSGRSYQIVQALLATANGGLIGRGPGLGNPGLVPVAHSDFIFAAITEETGLVGAVAIILLLALLANRGLRSALRAPDAFQRFLAVGLTAYLVGQSLLIIAGNLRLLPLTGVTLPFVSYGGSSLVVSMISLLLLVLISNAGPGRTQKDPTTRPIRQLGGLLMIGLAAAAVMAGWWALAQGPALLTRNDNPRRSINDRYVRRGSILDRQDRAINLSSGNPGEYVRQALYPDLGPVIGYTDPIYGQAGLEASLDEYLRGLQGNPLPMIWWSSLVYGQPPPGVDVRTTLDLDLQTSADRLLAGRKGALVLLNAQTGEILAMASHPTFNSNRLEELGEALQQNPDAPLLNRAAQGLYPYGAALGALILAKTNPDGTLSAASARSSYPFGEQTLSCAVLSARFDWAAVIGEGCPRPVVELGEQLGSQELSDFFGKLGIYSPPLAYLPVNSGSQPESSAAGDIALGAGQFGSPLQLGMAATAISAKGIRPAVKLVSAIKEPERGWVLLPGLDAPQRVLTESQANTAAHRLALPGRAFWQSLAVAPVDDQAVTWFLGGTLPEWKGTPLALVVLLEENNPSLAEEIGQKMLLAGMGD